MRAVRVVDGAVALVDVEEPAGAHDGISVLPVRAASICGTDLDLVANAMGGFTLGHEMVVVVDGIPYGVEPTIRCGACEQCRTGSTQRCTGEHGNLGIFSDGGLAERVAVPGYALVPLPAGLAAEDACLVEPAAVAWHGVRRAALEPGASVAVVGGGSIGLLVVAGLRSLGHPVDLDARHAHQRAAGERLGAGPVTRSDHYDVVIDAAGSASALHRCAELARPGARVVLLGVYYDTVPMPGVPLLVKELTCVGAMAYGRAEGTREIEQAAALLASDPGIAATLVTHRFALTEAPEAFRVAADRAAGAIKVVLEPD